MNLLELKRALFGKIDKIEDCPICKEKEYIFTEIKGDLHFENPYHAKDIAKHSPNIIDLVECGDYVNGSRILDITGDYINATEWNCCKSRLEKTIKSIVTKEAMKSVEYRIE